MLLIDSGPRSVGRGLWSMARAMCSGHVARTMAEPGTDWVGKTEHAKNLVPHPGSHDQFRETGNAEDEKAAGHLGIGPE